MTPEERALHACARAWVKETPDLLRWETHERVAQAIRDAETQAQAAGRAAALEDAAQIFEQKAQTCHPTYAPDRLAAGEYLGYADEIRSLINQGRDEVAPKSTQTSDIAAEEK